MATPSPTPSPTPQQPVRLVPQVGAPPTGPLAGDPAMVGLPSFVVGAVTVAMVGIGVVPTAAVGASMPIVIAAALGMFLATVWAARIGESAAAGISAIVGSFLLSYALLTLGLLHDWFKIPLTAVADTQKIFLISWIVIVSMLVLATLRMPMTYGILFLAVDAALVLDLLGVIQSSENLNKAGGWVLMGVAAIVVYLFFGSASKATGGKELPLGPPILHA